jgi:mannose-6-phosphate isomerase-like protein (cupin superfamily)
MRVDDETHELGPGVAVLAPAGSEHDLCNAGTTPLTVVVIWGPPSEPVDPSRYGTGRAARAAAGS